MLILTIAMTIWVFASNAMINHLELRIKVLEQESEMNRFVEQMKKEHDKDQLND